ncbi:MAG: tRNA (cytidine(34)-2'-O)-methyltransferase [Epsilonproteobacteria bacterium]|nr:tRNA (cytidine(34)-2'-O)-methyltransferase [Campylobacterota bacterium]
MFNIVLYNPQIPYNTGAIGRLCVNTNAKLHLIKPLGFSLAQKEIKRAGLDYWHKLNPTIWESHEEFFNQVDIARCFFATTKAQKPYFQAQFNLNDYIIFGSETSGIPLEIMQKNAQNMITIPMSQNGRSLNLAISAGIVLYEGIRQNYNIIKDMRW